MARPRKLQTIVADKIGQSMASAGREILSDVLREKLDKQGVDANRFPVDEFIDHVIAAKEEAFVWENGITQEVAVSLDFTEEDIQGISDRLKELEESRDAVVEECLEAAASVFLRRLERLHPEQKADDQTELYGFRKRLELRWGGPLDLFRMMLTLARELFDSEAESLGKSKAKTGQALREALLGIHARALRTGTAILVLLENGLADDAYARWRTLYELSVAAAFLSEHGEEAAERYVLHESVALKQQLDNVVSWGSQRIPSRVQRYIEEDYEAVVSTYGRQFAKPYGWAASFLDGNTNPKFAHLEESVKGRMIVPPYKESSFQVHGGRAGLLGLGSSDDITVVGHSNMGLDIPLTHSSECLTQVTCLQLFHSPGRDIVLMKALLSLNEKIEKQCRRVANKLAKEEAAI